MEERRKQNATRDGSLALRFSKDFMRVIVLLVAAVVFLIVGTPLARATGIEALGVWSLWTAAICLSFAVSHVGRRVLLPKIDLVKLVNKAMEDPVGAGIAAFGICYLLSALLSLTGLMLRT